VSGGVVDKLLGYHRNQRRSVKEHTAHGREGAPATSRRRASRS
jgi:hypothetical protein